MKKKGNKGMLIHQNRNSFITPSLHLCLLFVGVNKHFLVKKLYVNLCPQYLSSSNRNVSERNKDEELEGVWVYDDIGHH